MPQDGPLTAGGGRPLAPQGVWGWVCTVDPGAAGQCRTCWAPAHNAADHRRWFSKAMSLQSIRPNPRLGSRRPFLSRFFL